MARRRILLPLLLLLPLLGGAGLGTEPPGMATWTFGLSLATGPSSQLYSLYLVKEHNYDVVATEPITREQFMLQAQGAVTSKANPAGENLFRRYKVRECLHPEDSTKGVADCSVFDRLWKLRFKEYPFLLKNGGDPGKGWSEQREAPSRRQLLLLSDYGIMHLTGLARGEDAFRLLRDVGDSSWVDNYRKGS